MKKPRLGRRQALASGLAAIVTTAPSLSNAEMRTQAPLAQLDEDERILFGRFRQTLRTWMQAESQRFSLPISIGSETHETLELCVQNIHPAIKIWSERWPEIRVGISWDGDSGIMALFETMGNPAPGGAGWVIAWTLSEYEIVYPTIEASWRGEIFEHFLSYINDYLAQATEVAILDMDDGRWWCALLIRDGNVIGMGRKIAEIEGTVAHMLPVQGHPV